jgi:prepilin-type N-terminal cleavage/methylation domain-containing protein
MDTRIMKASHSNQNNRDIQLLNKLETQGSGQGFSLIEVMVAMVVLLMGIATNMSGDLLEIMKSTDYASIAQNSDTPLAVGETSLSGGVTFTRSWWVVANCASLNANGNTCTGISGPTCATVPDGAFAINASAIRARTCWVDKNGVNHSVTFDTVRVLEN